MMYHCRFQWRWIHAASLAIQYKDVAFPVYPIVDKTIVGMEIPLLVRRHVNIVITFRNKLKLISGKLIDMIKIFGSGSADMFKFVIYLAKLHCLHSHTRNDEANVVSLTGHRTTRLLSDVSLDVVLTLSSNKRMSNIPRYSVPLLSNSLVPEW